LSPVCQYKYEFFISYPQMAQPNRRHQVDEFAAALKNKLDYYQQSSQVMMAFRDKECLDPGYVWEQMIPRALCLSRAMLLVYSDEYFHREYCVKEFEAMRTLENLRGFRADSGESLIIPLIVQAREGTRGRAQLPDLISGLNHLDFRGILDPLPQFRTKFVREKIDQLLKRLQKFQAATADPGIDCHGFQFNNAVTTSSAQVPPPSYPGSWGAASPGV
jgi:hypothetical protein